MCNVKPDFVFLCVKLIKQLSFLRYEEMLDIWASDFPYKKERFEVNYLFLNILTSQRLVLRTYVQENQGLSSINELYSSAGWLEREVWDMFGVLFYNNHDLRRILTDYGFDGHPLRKDFPLSGFLEVRYDDSEKRVVYEPLEVSQEYRMFNFKSPWERL
jgi:NADH-quinone oxidoreductase subunit C